MRSRNRGNSLRTPGLTRPEQRKTANRNKEADLTAGWPDEQIVCHCTATSKGTILANLPKCHYDSDEIANRTGASTKCGTCLPFVEELCEITPRKKLRSRLPIYALGFVLIVCALFLLW